MDFVAGHSFEGVFNGPDHVDGVFTYQTGRTMQFAGRSDGDKGLTGTVVIKEADGSLVFDGKWLDNREEGQGTVHTDGNTYTGMFVQGRKHGRGKNTFSNGNVYEGEFKNDVIEGEGAMFYPEDQNRFEGTWKSGSWWNGRLIDSHGNA
jgi:hypothetical protein